MAKQILAVLARHSILILIAFLLVTMALNVGDNGLTVLETVRHTIQTPVNYKDK